MGIRLSAGPFPWAPRGRLHLRACPGSRTTLCSLMRPWHAERRDDPDPGPAPGHTGRPADHGGHGLLRRPGVRLHGRGPLAAQGPRGVRRSPRGQGTAGHAAHLIHALRRTAGDHRDGPARRLCRRATDRAVAGNDAGWGRRTGRGLHRDRSRAGAAAVHRDPDALRGVVPQEPRDRAPGTHCPEAGDLDHGLPEAHGLADLVLRRVLEPAPARPADRTGPRRGALRLRARPRAHRRRLARERGPARRALGHDRPDPGLPVPRCRARHDPPRPRGHRLRRRLDRSGPGADEHRALPLPHPGRGGR